MLSLLRRRYGDGAPVIALNAHGDVVPPGEGWTHDPYGGEVVDGRLYGRASAVSKSDFATFTPPPLPRPPACICAFTTQLLPPSWVAADTA